MPYSGCRTVPWDVFERLWERYDAWYERNRSIYESEVRAVLAALGGAERVLEIGVGTGRFASRLGVRRLVAGVDPAWGMIRAARGRGVDVAQGVGEKLPFRSDSFDAALLTVTLCFVDDPVAVLRESARVAARVASCIVPRDSPWGRLYASKRDSPFYRVARFYTIGEVAEMYRVAGLEAEGCISTLYARPPGPMHPEEPRMECSGEAGFVCIIGVRRPRA